MTMTTELPPMRFDRAKFVRIRLDAGLSPLLLSVRANVHVKTIRRLEAGITRDPRAAVVKRLADALGVNAMDLWTVDQS